MHHLKMFSVIIVIFAALTLAGAPNSAPAVPPNTPAQIDIAGGKIVVRYAGGTIFEGSVENGNEAFQSRINIYRSGDRIEQVLLLTSSALRQRMKLAGTVAGSGQAFPCEIDRPNRGPLLVRHASGLSRSLRNRAVYDRGADWALSIDFGPRAVVRPADPAKSDARTFALECEGNEIVLRFRPRFYQKHRGLSFFEPWTYRVWPKSVAGWISWFAFFDRVTEKDIVETADAFSAAMGPYGYDILQIDDGYQSGKGAPKLWLNPNAKFPSGLNTSPPPSSRRASCRAYGRARASPTATRPSPIRSGSSGTRTANPPAETGSTTSWTPPTRPRSRR
jgi:hypothetical protein